jgi:hypothetical protein
MDYAVKEPLWQFVDHWQTLVTGLLAVLAAIGTIWATIKSANREISAAQAQTKVAQDQIAATLRIEHRRIVREAWAFYVTLEAAMAIVANDVKAARESYNPPGVGHQNTQAFYEIRQRIRKSAFPEIRSVCLRLGGSLTSSFLRLDNEIDNFAAQWLPSQTSQGLALRLGKGAGLLDQLDRIEQQANLLREEAGAARKKCLEALAEKDNDPALVEGVSAVPHSV